MSIDVAANVKRLGNHVANRSLIGETLGNPMFVAALIVFVIFMILFAYEAECLNFQVMFYLSIFITGIQLLQNAITGERLRNLYENTSERDMVTPADVDVTGRGYEIAPRGITAHSPEFIEDDIHTPDTPDTDLGLASLLRA